MGNVHVCPPNLQPNIWGESPVHAAARTGSTSLQALCTALATAPHAPTTARSCLAHILNLPNGKGCTPLHISCQGGDEEALSLLLTLGASPLVTDRMGRLPLHVACLRGSSSMVHALLAHSLGATRQLAVQTLSGFTALHYAVRGGSTACVQAVLAGRPSLSVASTHTSWEVEYELPAGTTALHIAAAVATPEVAQLLLSHLATLVHSRGGARAGPDPRTLVDKRGRTPYDIARKRRKHELAQLLDPRVPLSVYMPTLWGTSLQSLAAQALKQHLQQSLAAAHPSAMPPVAMSGGATGVQQQPSQQQQQHMQHQQVVLHGEGVSVTCHGPDTRHGLDNDDAEGCCDICYGSMQLVNIQGCSHRLCSSCAAQLVDGLEQRPVTCPFCRGPIRGFECA